jgi:glycosyltransferase involved in cell wall biosynthesis
VKYLPQFGWQPLVVTVKEIAYYAHDRVLLEEVAATPIHRAGSLDPQRLLAILFSKRQPARAPKSAGRLLRALNVLAAWCFIPDAKLLWLPFAVLKARRLLRKQNIACVLTTSPPHSVHLAGVFLKKISGRPLVVDFRDGWSGGNFQHEPTPIHRWLNDVLEKYVLKSADAVIAVSERLTESLHKKSSPAPEKFSTITNGFDAEDFPAPAENFDKKFTIVYCGAVSAIAPLEGFWAGLSGFLKNHPAAREKISIKLIGQILQANFDARLQELNLTEIVEYTGYLPHREALAELRRAHLLLYPIADWASADFIPGKTFEYLAAGAPVLALGPAVEGVAILQRHGTLERCAHDDAAAIAQVIAKYFNLQQRGLLRKKSTRDLQQFERRILAQRLAQIFDELS